MRPGRVVVHQASHPPVPPRGVLRRDSDHEPADRCCRQLPLPCCGPLPEADPASACPRRPRQRVRAGRIKVQVRTDSRVPEPHRPTWRDVAEMSPRRRAHRGSFIGMVLTGNKPLPDTSTSLSPGIRRTQPDTCRISRPRDAPPGDLWPESPHLFGARHIKRFRSLCVVHGQDREQSRSTALKVAAVMRSKQKASRALFPMPKFGAFKFSQIRNPELSGPYCRLS
jgi:hypothetical protein